MLERTPTGLAAYRNIHLVGAGGAGMRGLAVLLSGLGHAVTGSDLEASSHLDALAGHGIETWAGHRPDRATGWDLVVASSAVPPSDPELTAAAAAGVAVWGRPRLLGELTALLPAVGVTGTHGKTSSTALAVAAVQAAGADPSYLVGGDLIDAGGGARLADRDLFLLEADEAFGTFLDLHLRALLVTNVEADHLDHYGTVDHLEQAFLTVARGVDGPLVIGIDDPGGRRLAKRLTAVTYGTSLDADWVVDDVAGGLWEVSFTVTAGPRSFVVKVPRPGIHVARNAAGVLALVDALGLDVADAVSGLAGFAGVRRRHEVRARIAGVTIVDDYAHHPTELAATVAAAGTGAWHRVWAVFQPHRYSRTAEHAAALGASLSGADRVVVTDVYAAGEPPIPGISGELVAEGARAAGAADVTYVPDRDQLAGYVAAAAGTGDVVLLLGAGDITAVADELIALLGSGDMSGIAALVAAGMVRKDVPLAPLTTYKLGGPARYFAEPSDEADLAALGAAWRADEGAGIAYEILILGRGSNLVVSDKGFAGVVIRLGAGLGRIRLEAAGRVVAGGAAFSPALARRSVEAGRGGLEFYVGIPGLVGGAVAMNASCLGTATADVLGRARVVDLRTGTATWETPATLDLSYRHSRLTATDVVVAAEFATEPVDPAVGRRRMRELTQWRRRAQPGGTYNAGSVFKNPPGERAAGAIIDGLGLKGLRRGGVVVSDRHANFFEAGAGATAQDVHDLVGAVRARVSAETGIDLEPEIQFAGDFGGSL